MTFANSLGPEPSSPFSPIWAPPNPPLNITHSLYDICQFLGPRPPGPFSPLCRAFSILIEVSYILFMTFANSWAHSLLAHFDSYPPTLHRIAPVWPMPEGLWIDVPFPAPARSAVKTDAQ